MENIDAIIIAKSKDYLLGYIDCLVEFKNANNIERLDISNGNVTGSEQNEILGPVYIDLTCSCGNYVAFKTKDEIPNKSFKCSLCEKKYMIYYVDEFK